MRLGKHPVQWAFAHRGTHKPTQPCEANIFFSGAAAYGGPPQHFTEAWQDELWKTLSMHPVKQSHLKGPATSPAKSTQLLAPPALHQKPHISAFPPPMNTRSKWAQPLLLRALGMTGRMRLKPFELPNLSTSKNGHTHHVLGRSRRPTSSRDWARVRRRGTRS